MSQQSVNASNLFEIPNGPSTTTPCRARFRIEITSILFERLPKINTTLNVRLA